MTHDIKIKDAKIHLVAISGHLKPHNATLQATKIALDYASTLGVQTMLFDLSSITIPFQDESKDLSDRFLEVASMRLAVKDADAVLLSTPEYHGSFSGGLKNALDLMSDHEFKGKAVGLLSLAGGSQGISSLNHLRLVMRSLHAVAIPSQVSIAHSYHAFDANGKFTDKDSENRLFEMVAELVHYAKIFKLSNVPSQA